MRGRGVLATLLALAVPVAMAAVARAGTDTGAPGIVVTTPSPSGYTSYGGIHLQSIGATTLTTYDEWIGVAGLTPAANRAEMNFSPANFLLNANSAGTSGDCVGNYGVGSLASPATNAVTMTWSPSAATLTSRFVTSNLDCTVVFRNFAQELANAKGWTLAQAQSALLDVNSLRVVADDRQAGTLVSFTGGVVDGSFGLGPMDPGPGVTNSWLATDYDYDAPDGFTLSGTLNLGGSFGSCETTCGIEITFGHFVPPNRPPVVSDHAADASGLHGTVLSTHGAFTDPDGDPLVITGSGAGVVTDNGDGTWTWQDIPPADGSDTVSVSASDGKGGTATDAFTWTAVNAAPIVGDHASDATGHPGTTLTTHGSFTDANGDPLSIGGVGAGHVTDNGDGTWSWDYAPSGVGSDSVSVTASDGDGGTATDTFTWAATNAAPVVSEHATDATGHRGDTLTTHGSFTDPDGDPLSIGGVGAGHVTDNGDGSWSWTFVPLDDGTGTVSVTASDGLGGTATDTFAWTVANAPPVVSAHANDANGHEGDTLTTHGSFSDPDGDPLSITGSGAGHVTDNGDGTWSWSFVPPDDGSGTVTVTASDGNGGSATDTFSWSAANVAPTIVSLIPDTATALAGQDVTWTATATDPGVNDTFTWWFDGGAPQPGPLATTFTRTYTDCGTYSLDARIADDDGGTDHATSDATVTVVKATALSPVDPSGVTLVQKGQTLPVKVQVGCGSSIDGLHPGIGLEFDDHYYAADSASSADSPGVMRFTSGEYQYNLRVPRSLGGHELVQGDQVTVLVEPFGDEGGALPIVLQIRK